MSFTKNNVLSAVYSALMCLSAHWGCHQVATTPDRDMSPRSEHDVSADEGSLQKHDNNHRITIELEGPKKPAHAGVGDGSTVTGTLQIATSIDPGPGDQECPLDCASDCVSVTADKLLVVRGGAKNWPGSEQLANTAMSVFGRECGGENAIYLDQPSPEALRRTLEAHKKDLLGLVFIGHGFSRGVLLFDTDSGAPSLIASDRRNLLTPAALQDILVGDAVPKVQFFSCDQGTPRPFWEDATHADELVFADGAIRIDQLTPALIEQFVDRIPCSQQKWSCPL